MSKATQQSNVDRRRAPRVDGANHLLWLDAGDGRERIACLVWDISVTGAQLRLSDNAELPAIAEILISGAPHRARIVWRKESHIGVEFIEQLERWRCFLNERVMRISEA